MDILCLLFVFIEYIVSKDRQWMSSPTSVMAVVNWFAGCYKTGTQCGAAERISTDEYKLLVLKIKLALRPQHCQIVQQIVMATSL